MNDGGRKEFERQYANYDEYANFATTNCNLDSDVEYKIYNDIEIQIAWQWFKAGMLYRE